MKGLLNIYIEKNTKDISILILHVTSIGFSRSIGSIIENIDIKSLKERVFRYLMLSLENYKYDKEEFSFKRVLEPSQRDKRLSQRPWHHYHKNKRSGIRSI